MSSNVVLIKFPLTRDSMPEPKPSSNDLGAVKHHIDDALIEAWANQMIDLLEIELETDIYGPEADAFVRATIQFIKSYLFSVPE